MKHMLHLGTNVRFYFLPCLDRRHALAVGQRVHRAAELGNLPVHVGENAAFGLRPQHFIALVRDGGADVGKHFQCHLLLHNVFTTGKTDLVHDTATCQIGLSQSCKKWAEQISGSLRPCVNGLALSE